MVSLIWGTTITWLASLPVSLKLPAKATFPIIDGARKSLDCDLLHTQFWTPPRYWRWPPQMAVRPA
jgi:hypothetical protein